MVRDVHIVSAISSWVPDFAWSYIHPRGPCTQYPSRPIPRTSLSPGPLSDIVTIPFATTVPRRTVLLAGERPRLLFGCHISLTAPCQPELPKLAWPGELHHTTCNQNNHPLQTAYLRDISAAAPSLCDEDPQYFCLGACGQRARKTARTYSGGDKRITLSPVSPGPPLGKVIAHTCCRD